MSNLPSDPNKTSSTSAGKPTKGDRTAGQTFGLENMGFGSAILGWTVPGAEQIFNSFAQNPRAQIGGPSWKPILAPNATVLDVMRAFVNGTKAQIVAIQQMMYQAGIYTNKKLPLWGTITGRDRDAFKKVLVDYAVNPTQKDANGNKQNFPTYLSNIADIGIKNGQGATSVHPPNTITLDDPAALRTMIQDTAQKLYGGWLPEDEVQKFINTFQSQNASYQTQQYNQAYGTGPGGYGPGGTAIKPDANAEAEQYIRTQHPNQVAATQFGNAMAPIIDTLKNPAV